MMRMKIFVHPLIKVLIIASMMFGFYPSEYMVKAAGTTTVIVDTSLPVPQGLSVGTVRSTSVTLTWTTVSGATKYSIYRADAGSTQFNYVGQSQPGIATYIDNNISPSTTYDYKVSSVFVDTGGQASESPQSTKVTVTSAAPPANFPTSATGYTVNDNFNGNTTGAAPSGWNPNTSGGTVTVQEVPFPTDKSVKIYKSSTSNDAAATKLFSSLSGKVTVEAKVKTTENSGVRYIPNIYDNNGNKIASVAFSNGNIAYNKNGTLTNIDPYVADKWYIIKVVLDTTANTYDVFVDGIRKVSSINFLYASNNVGQAGFRINSGDTGTLYFDNVKVYSQSTFIGGPPSPVFDVKNYGAKGDGSTKDTAAIQAAINAAAGTGGSVYLHDGIFLSGMIQLKSNMTLYIDYSATLKGSTSISDYPDTHPLTYNTQLGPDSNVNKALIYVNNVENVRIDGGGNIDGNGDSFTTGSEPQRPSAIYSVLSSMVTIQNLYIKKSGMWTVVLAETDYLTLRNLNLYVNILSNRDGIDIVDSKHVLVEDVTVNSGDDAICIKSGKRRGVEDVLVKNSNVTASSTNGLKFGTASYGAFKNVKFQDIMIKDVKYCAMCVESVDGADVKDITFQNIDVQDAGNPFFVILGKRSDRTTQDDVPKTGTMDTVKFQNIIGKNMKNTWGSPISGANMSDGTKYRIKNIYFDNVNITYKGGKTSVPGNPPEYALGQYPESNLWGDLPAYGYYIRHADGVFFTNSTTNVSPSDVRSSTIKNDVN
ncbi:glycoside hydrolase family 28 protein [Paenibacillus radicis (ex Xue et al. 2023)]|uniref:Glycosyl hydrolase family 28 protein n=1 Tax=Paenibacillus radicis (ex Xue et al. 2023) TaxID=2972489 RepID=A0ABT1YJ57_9BACL|nr:glycosyl hydrolase family 28 protein [Paenibacillus radicis (ex Xue et al. 2023)]MCR8633196.1 glycosyl hydrolase family 28 protein [Paenibacillus radicis (ex Xue et al. 2023)]